MPGRVAFLRKSLKHVCADTVLFFAIVAIVGHLTINFWERYTIQTELSDMKQYLHTLKDTITNIGKAYDNLNAELKDILNVVDKKQTFIHHGDAGRKIKNNLDRRTLHDIKVQTLLTQPNKIEFDKGRSIYHRRDRENKSTGTSGRNATTNTINPPKSTGITSNMSKYEREKYLNDPKRISSNHNHLRCHRNHCKLGH